jgi:hypothetical protein
MKGAGRGRRRKRLDEDEDEMEFEFDAADRNKSVNYFVPSISIYTVSTYFRVASAVF